MQVEEERRFAELARNLTRSRDMAGTLSMPFVSRLIDLSLLELAMNWQGRDPQASMGTENCGLEDLLQLKLRLTLIERNGKLQRDQN